MRSRILSYLLIVSMIFPSAPIFSKEQFMCGRDINNDDYVSQIEMFDCLGEDKKLCPYESMKCMSETDVFNFDPNFNCPSEYSYNSTSTFCEKINQSSATYNCSSGYSYNPSSSKCEITITNNIDHVCPYGYSYNSSSGFCENTVTSTASYSCSSGYMYNSASRRCEKTETASLQNACPSGYTNNGSSCQKTNSTSVILSCPTGTVKVGNYCKSENRSCGYDRNPSSQRYYSVPITDPYNLGNMVFYHGSIYASKPNQYITNTIPSNYRRGALMETENGFGGKYKLYELCIAEEELYPIREMCPSGYSKSGSQCYQTITRPKIDSCPSGFYKQGNSCYKIITQTPTVSCQAGYYQQGSSCVKKLQVADTETCPTGFFKSGNYCEKELQEEPSVVCPAGKDYNSDSKKCESMLVSTPSIVCPSGSTYDSGKNKCERVDAYSVCPIDGSRDSCIKDDGGEMMCSPNKCINVLDPDNNIGIDGPDGTMLVDDGRKNEQGMCLEQLYIFNGRASRCKLSGFSSAYKNCCADADKVLNDSSGSSQSVATNVGKQTITAIYEAASVAYTTYTAQTAAGVSSAFAGELATSAASEAFIGAFDPMSLAIAIAVAIIMNWIANACDQMDAETAIAKDSGYCHEVGTFCKKKVSFIGCIQKAKGLCCYNSKLSRIIAEQGRPQLTTFHGWGSPEAPECRGFTPEEFQQLDFSKINLNEYIDELQTNSQLEVEDKMTKATEKFYDAIK